jgi:succinate dehydrogenase/fumarate reductase flavoprotein subunit
MNFRFGQPQTIICDILVIGGGGAGCQAALWAQKAGAAKVALIEKGIIGASGCTVMGTYSCCAALGYSDPRDTPEVHFDDTWKAGAEIGDPELIRIYVEEAPARVLELAESGVPFEKEAGRLKQSFMFGHTYPRACYVGLRTGQAMQWGLRKKVKESPGVRRLNDVQIYRLIVRDGEVWGAVGICRRTLNLVHIQAKATVIATGGCGQLYLHSTTSLDNTGDGIAMAFEAGASLMDMEFLQYYPVSAIFPRFIGMNRTAPTFLALVPGCRIYNRRGEDFVDRQYPTWRSSLSRDFLSQLIYREVMEGRGSPHGGAFMDVRGASLEDIRRHLSLASYDRKIQSMGIDLQNTVLEVGPASHFFMGGIRIGPYGETRLPGLFAAGEASAGVHGANRLGGNALSEILVTGARAGKGAVRFAAQRKGSHPLQIERTTWEDWIEELLARPRKALPPSQWRKRLQEAMWKYGGVIRSGRGLRTGLEVLEELEKSLQTDVALSYGPRAYHCQLSEAIEIRLMLPIARCILSAALRREESRGAHFREDCPQPQAHWRANQIVTRIDGKTTWEVQRR